MFEKEMCEDLRETEVSVQTGQDPDLYIHHYLHPEIEILKTVSRISSSNT